LFHVVNLLKCVVTEVVSTKLGQTGTKMEPIFGKGGGKTTLIHWQNTKQVN